MQPTQEDTQLLMESATAQEERWVSALGRYVFIFTKLELLTYWLIERFAPSPEVATEAAKDPLARRLKSCERFISADKRITNEKLQADWRGWLVDASRAAKDRNAILHNPSGYLLRGR